MKKIFVLILVALSVSFSNCEKDDICDGITPTTSRLVISFYDFTRSDELKNTQNLKIIAEGFEEGITYNGSTLFNSNKIAVPLQTNLDVTTFKFILNYQSTNPNLPQNEDVISFNYTRSNEFVSRACGYKTIFTLDEFLPFTHNDGVTNDQKWIRFIEVTQEIIDNENQTHLEIYF